MHLLNETLIEHNSAPVGYGASVYLLFGSTLECSIDTPHHRIARSTSCLSTRWMMHLGSWGKGGPPDLLTRCPSPSTDNTGPLRVDRPQTYDFLESLLGEVAVKFPDQVFHGGE